MDLETPPDSPLWWPLSDEITASELRSIYRDKAGHLDRYQQAVEAGLAYPIPAGHEDELTFYYNRKHNPELTPIWQIFSTFATFLAERTSQEDLERFGISPEGVETVFTMAAKQAREERAMVEALRQEGEEFMAVFGQLHRLARSEPELKAEQLGAAGRDLTPSSLRTAMAEDDLAFLATVSGKSPTKLQRLLEVARSNPPAATAGPNILLLRDRLSESDWHAFKLFLWSTVEGSQSGFMDFAD